MEGNTDRKVVLALAAKRLLAAIESFVEEHESMIESVLKMNESEAREYLMEVAIDACHLMRELKGK